MADNKNNHPEIYSKIAKLLIVALSEYLPDQEDVENKQGLIDIGFENIDADVFSIKGKLPTQTYEKVYKYAMNHSSKSMLEALINMVDGFEDNLNS